MCSRSQNSRHLLSAIAVSQRYVSSLSALTRAPHISAMATCACCPTSRNFAACFGEFVARIGGGYEARAAQRGEESTLIRVRTLFSTRGC